MAMAQSGQECYEKSKECFFSNKLTEAVEWARKGAEQGHPQAQYNLGIYYKEGRGVAKDEAEAEKWFRMAEETNARFQK